MIRFAEPIPAGLGGLGRSFSGLGKEENVSPCAARTGLGGLGGLGKNGDSVLEKTPAWPCAKKTSATGWDSPQTTQTTQTMGSHVPYVNQYLEQVNLTLHPDLADPRNAPLGRTGYADVWEDRETSPPLRWERLTGSVLTRHRRRVAHAAHCRAITPEQAAAMTARLDALEGLL